MSAPNQKLQASLQKAHQNLFALISNGKSPVEAGEILGYTPDAVKSIIDCFNGQSASEISPVTLTAKTDDQLVAEGKTMAIHKLIRIMMDSDNDNAIVKAAGIMMAIEGGRIDDGSTGKLKDMIKRMKEAVYAQEKTPVILKSALATSLSDQKIIEIGDEKVADSCMAGAI